MMLRTRWIFVVLATFALALAVPATSAWADAGSGDTSAPPSTDTKVPDETEAPPTTETAPPVTTASTCDDTSSCTETTTTTPETPDVECTEDCVPDTGCTEDCTPDTPNTVPEDVPGTTPGSGTELPFTGPGDVALAIVLALLAGTGGMLFLFGASGREQLEGLNHRGMDSPSGFHVAYRELRKQQLDD
jgi:hypothetical protein